MAALPGGVISAITKSGGNSFHGDVHYYYFGNALNAGAPKRLVMDPTDLLTVTYQQDYKFPLSNHEAGYSLGGPLSRISCISLVRHHLDSSRRTRISSLRTSRPSTFIRTSSSGRRTTKFRTIRLRNCASTQRSCGLRTARQGIFPAFTGYANSSTSSASSVLANQNRGTFSPQSNYNADINWTVTPTTLVQVRGARFWDNYKALGVLDQSAVEWGNSSQNITSFAVPANLQQPHQYIQHSSRAKHGVRSRDSHNGSGSTLAIT